MRIQEIKQRLPNSGNEILLTLVARIDVKHAQCQLWQLADTTVSWSQKYLLLWCVFSSELFFIRFCSRADICLHIDKSFSEKKMINLIDITFACVSMSYFCFVLSAPTKIIHVRIHLHTAREYSASLWITWKLYKHEYKLQRWLMTPDTRSRCSRS